MSASNLIVAVILSLVLHALAAGRAHAYLDPGSGSFIFQMIVAALLSAGVVLKIYWTKVKRLFSSSSEKCDPDSDDDE